MTKVDGSVQVVIWRKTGTAPPLPVAGEGLMMAAAESGNSPPLDGVTGDAAPTSRQGLFCSRDTEDSCLIDFIAV